jgi:hypothetical protein
MIEEKFNTLNAKIDQEKNQRIIDNELLRKSMRVFEDLQSTLQIKIDGMLQNSKELATALNNLSQNFTELKKAAEIDRNEKLDQAKGFSKQLQSMYNELKQQIYIEQTARKQQNDSLSNLISSESQGLSGKISTLKLHTEQSITLAIAPLSDLMEKLTSTLHKEHQQREDLQKSHEQKHSEIEAAFKDILNKESSRIEDLIKNQEKQWSQKHWNMQMTMDTDIEQGQKNYHSLLRMVEEAEHKRVESEEHLLHHISSLLTRFRNGMDTGDDDLMMMSVAQNDSSNKLL